MQLYINSSNIKCTPIGEHFMIMLIWRRTFYDHVNILENLNLIKTGNVNLMNIEIFIYENCLLCKLIHLAYTSKSYYSLMNKKRR